MDARYYTYDIECLKNVYTLRAEHMASGKKYCYEISQRKDEREQLFYFLNYLRNNGCVMIGFNNLSYDWEVTQWLMENPWANNMQIYQQSQSRITGKPSYPMWPDRRLVPQIDLLKIHHFDNPAKMTSLKALEIAMRMDSVEEFECDWNEPLPVERIPDLIRYNGHDVKATTDFAIKSMDMIEFREHLTEKYKVDFMNKADTQIGAEVFVQELEKAGVPCYEKDHNGRKQKRQTHRDSIALAECIFPYVGLEHPAFQMIYQFFMRQVITETKGVFNNFPVTWDMIQYMDPKLIKVWLKGAKKPHRLAHYPEGTDFTDAKMLAVNLHCRIDGFNYYFGTGGLHASLHREVLISNEFFKIRDRDVASFYPNLAIKNKVFPAHLSPVYCAISEYLFNERINVGKKSMMGGAYKLALNGTYGNSNNDHSPFKDPMYTMKITINGQLLLCMLVEQLIKVPGLRMIQCNTDGITYYCPVEYLDHVEAICQWWQGFTCLELEEACYSKMFIRDVNNYRADYDRTMHTFDKEEKYVKLKGAYEIKREWHKDHSSLVVQKAVAAHMADGTDIAQFIFAHKDEYDFMIRGKVNRNCSLHLVYADGTERKTSNIMRYYVANAGGELVKRTKPKGIPNTWKRKNGITDRVFNQVMQEITGQQGKLDAAGTPHDERIHTKNKSQWGSVLETGLAAGLLVDECSKASDFNWRNVNYMWYIAQAYKLVI